MLLPWKLELLAWWKLPWKEIEVDGSFNEEKEMEPTNETTFMVTFMEVNGSELTSTEVGGSRQGR